MRSTLPTTPVMQASNGDFLTEVVKAGLGLVIQPDFILCDAVRAGQLRLLLPDYTFDSGLSLIRLKLKLARRLYAGPYCLGEEMMMKRLLTLTVVGTTLMTLAACAHSEANADNLNVAMPDATSQKFATDLRRTSIIVSDIDESLKLYRDVLGFEVNYDTEVTMSGKALPAGEPGAKARLVLISTNDSWVGWIGLLEWLDPKLDIPEPRRRMGIGDALLVFNTEKVDEHCSAAAKLDGVFMTAPAGNTTYPARAGGDPIVVRTCYLFDRDGYFMELNKVLDRDNYNKG